MRVYNAFNYPGPYRERSSLPSITVPDEGLSLRDLIDRHNRGGKVKTFTPVYDDHTPPGIENLNAIDREIMSRDVGDFIKTTRGRLISAREAAKRALHEQRIISEHERKRKSRSDIEEAIADDV